MPTHGSRLMVRPAKHNLVLQLTNRGSRFQNLLFTEILPILLTQNPHFIHSTEQLDHVAKIIVNSRVHNVNEQCFKGSDLPYGWS